MTEPSNVESLTSALVSLRVVRHSFGSFLKTLAEGKTSSDGGSSELEPGETNESHVEKLFSAFRTNLSELEKNISNLTPGPVTTPGPPSAALTNIDVLALDPSPDKLNLYHQLLDCYTWIDKVSKYSDMIYSNFNGNHLKRSSIPTKKKRPSTPTIYDANICPQIVDKHIQNIKNIFPDMILNVVRPMGSNAVLQVTLGHVLKAIVTFRGLLIEGVVVRAYNELHTDEDGKVDLYHPSKYKVFQKVTDNANAAMLHFFTPGLYDLSIRSFFAWLNSYSNLFTKPCKKCNYHIRYNFPPTWREFKELEPYHEECRP